jgi:hypothetical protein
MKNDGMGFEVVIPSILISNRDSKILLDYLASK